jgi:hypothetical protein
MPDDYQRETFTSRAIIFVIIKQLPRFVFTVEPDQMKERMRYMLGRDMLCLPWHIKKDGIHEANDDF